MKRKTGRYSKYIRPIQIFTDLSLINVLVLVCMRPAMANFGFFTIVSSFWLFVSYYSGYYEVYRYTKETEIFWKVIKQFFFISLVTFAYAGYKYKYVTTNEVWYYILMCAGIIGLIKLSISYLLKKYRVFYGLNTRNVIIVGNGKSADDLAEFFNQNTDYGYNLVKKFSLKENKKQELNSIEDFINTKEIDEVYGSINSLTNNEIDDLISISEHNLKTVKLIPDRQSAFYRNLAVEYYGYIPIISLRTIPLDKEVNKRFKRFFDVVFSILVIVLILSWLVPILGLLIKIESKGSVFFKQSRPGINEKEFQCYKFRSMKLNQNTEKEASRNDPRVTKLGRFMRKTSIDELPQFFNVLLGDMSVVGPRPHLWTQNKVYGKRIKKYMVRHHVKPGITGFAQVKGYRGEIETDQDMINRIKFDVYYIENWSFLLDARIIFQTVVNIFKGEDKAY